MDTSQNCHVCLSGICGDTPTVLALIRGLCLSAELRSQASELEQRLQGQERELRSQGDRIQEMQLQRDRARGELAERDKALSKSGDELARVGAQYEQASAKVGMVTGRAGKRQGEEVKSGWTWGWPWEPVRAGMDAGVLGELGWVWGPRRARVDTDRYGTLSSILDSQSRHTGEGHSHTWTACPPSLVTWIVLPTFQRCEPQNSACTPHSSSFAALSSAYV